MPTVASAQKAVIKGPTESKPGDLVVLDASSSVGTKYKWALVNSDKTFLPVESNTKVVFSSGEQGSYKFMLAVAGFDVKNQPDIDVAFFTVVVGSPVPPSPVPVPPSPDPKPPVPNTNGLLVLIIEEVGDRDKLPPGQLSTLKSTVIRSYLDTHCAKNSKGVPEYRVYDKDQEPTESNFADALKLAKSTQGFKTPWIVISNGQTGESTPLPTTLDDSLKLLKKYGG
jgi:hypothetical protein